jgi:hypothetical protein
LASYQEISAAFSYLITGLEEEDMACCYRLEGDKRDEKPRLDEKPYAEFVVRAIVRFIQQRSVRIRLNITK